MLTQVTHSLSGSPPEKMPSSSSSSFMSANSMTRSDKSKCLNASLQEWSIPSKDVKFSEVLTSGNFGDVCRYVISLIFHCKLVLTFPHLLHIFSGDFVLTRNSGRWHGEVMIYTFPSCKEEEDLEILWQQVAIFSRLRHENLQLFMGAIVEPVPCIITSMKKGPTLYEKIHVANDFLSRTYKISIARQVTQAIGYLHAKNIAFSHTSINSHHIILENKVKLCLIDLTNTSSCPCVPCASTLGLISVFIRSPIHQLTSHKTTTATTTSSKMSRMETNFNNRQSPPSSPRLLGLSNDALNVIGRD